MEVETRKVVKTVEVEEEMFCFTYEETALISDILGQMSRETLTKMGFTLSAIDREEKIYDYLFDNCIHTMENFNEDSL